MRDNRANMNYKDWVEAVPELIREDPVWRVEAYRLALFAGDLAWHDATKLLEKAPIAEVESPAPAAALHAPRITWHKSRSAHHDSRL